MYNKLLPYFIFFLEILFVKLHLWHLISPYGVDSFLVFHLSDFFQKNIWQNKCFPNMQALEKFMTSSPKKVEISEKQSELMETRLLYGIDNGLNLNA